MAVVDDVSVTDVQGGRLPAQTAGRNDPCPCQSGRKFKACCQPRLVYMRSHDDCVRAATATVLGIRYAETPDVDTSSPSCVAVWADWEAARGLQSMESRERLQEAADAAEWSIVTIEGWPELHAVVARRGELFHDPARAFRRAAGALRAVNVVTYVPSPEAA